MSGPNFDAAAETRLRRSLAQKSEECASLEGLQRQLQTALREAVGRADAAETALAAASGRASTAERDLGEASAAVEELAHQLEAEHDGAQTARAAADAATRRADAAEARAEAAEAAARDNAARAMRAEARAATAELQLEKATASVKARPFRSILAANHAPWIALCAALCEEKCQSLTVANCAPCLPWPCAVAFGGERHAGAQAVR